MTTATELLRRAQRALEASDDHYELQDSIENFLAAEPEAEPIGVLHPNGRFELTRDELPLHLAFPVKLYTKPEPARKPMTEEEVSKLFPGMPTEYEAGFRDGIDFAEKHHFGIGGDDNG